MNIYIEHDVLYLLFCETVRSHHEMGRFAAHLNFRRTFTRVTAESAFDDTRLPHFEVVSYKVNDRFLYLEFTSVFLPFDRECFFLCATQAKPGLPNVELLLL